MKAGQIQIISRLLATLLMILFLLGMFANLFVTSDRSTIDYEV